MTFHGQRERWNADAGQLSCVARRHEFVADIGARRDALDWLETLWRGGGPYASAVRRADRTEQSIVAASSTQVGSGSNSPGSVTPSCCLPSTFASTMSGASRVNPL